MSVAAIRHALFGESLLPPDLRCVVLYFMLGIPSEDIVRAIDLQRNIQG